MMGLIKFNGNDQVLQWVTAASFTSCTFIGISESQHFDDILDILSQDEQSENTETQQIWDIYLLIRGGWGGGTTNFYHIIPLQPFTIEWQPVWYIYN